LFVCLFVCLLLCLSGGLVGSWLSDQLFSKFESQDILRILSESELLFLFAPLL